MLSSRGSFQPRDWTQVSWIAGRFFTIWTTREALAFWDPSKTRVLLFIRSDSILDLAEITRPKKALGPLLPRCLHTRQQDGKCKANKDPTLAHLVEPGLKQPSSKMKTQPLENFGDRRQDVCPQAAHSLEELGPQQFWMSKRTCWVFQESSKKHRVNLVYMG